MKRLAVVFLVLALLMFVQAYHNIDLSYNNKFSFVDIGNGLDGAQMHTLGMGQLFLSVALMAIAVIIKE